ncbi:MAG: helix-turn-helix domain-containing protein [Dehalococcoidia bacterium]
MEKPLLTIREVAQMLHVHVNTVRRWSNQGIIPSYRLGVRGVRRFKREEVEELVTRLKKNEGE